MCAQGYAVQRDELQRVCAGGERASAARDEAVVQQAALGRRQAGVPHRPDREPEGHHRH